MVMNKKKYEFKGYIFVPPKEINLRIYEAYEIFDWLHSNLTNENVLELEEYLIYELSLIWEEIHIEGEFILERGESYWIEDENSLKKIRSNIEKVRNLTSSQEAIKNEVIRLIDLAIQIKQPIFYRF